jgi:hypothetical protein
MIHYTRNNFFASLVSGLVAMVALVVLGTGWAATAQAQTASRSAHSSAVQQPLYSQYRGVRIGMSTEEVRAKLGEPLQKADDGDFYVFSEKETAQVAYDAAHKVTVVSVDYLGGVGAPDYKLVVGPDVEAKADGSIYKLVRYESLGFWVYYNRSAGEVPVVTITIQKSLQSR